MDRLVQDLRQTFRRLVDAPGFTVMALLITGLGIGANVAMFSVVESFLFRPPPWEDVDELVWVYQDSDDGEPNSSSFPAYRDIASQDAVFVDAAALIPGRTARYLTPAGESQSVAVSYATASLFPTLGLEASRGRWFSSDADVPGGEPVGVVSHHAWQNRFFGDPAIVGRSVRLNRTAVTIVGVGPAGYRGEMSGVNTDFWLSLAAAGPVGGDYYWDTLEQRGDHWFLVVGRLREGMSIDSSQAAMDALAARLAADYPEHNDGRDITVFAASSVRLHPEYDAMLFPSGAALMGIVGLVLLIACGNLANLLLAKASTRGREIAVRLAMGATRARVVRQLLTESVVLAIGGGLVGLGVASLMGAGLTALSASMPLPMPMIFEVRLDGRILAFAMALSVATGLVFGLVPSLRASRPTLLPGLKEDGGLGGATTALRWFSLRNMLVAMQIAVSFVLLIGAGLLVRSLINAEQATLGFAPDGLAVVQADVGEAGYEPDAGRALIEQWRERISGVAGVEDVTLTTRLPVTPRGGSSTLEVEGYEPRMGTGKAEVIFAYVDENYFRALKVPLLHGRSFTASDRVDSERVAVVNEAFSRRYWGTSDGTGRRYRHEGAPDSWVRVVGIVSDVKVRAPHEAATPMFFRPLRQGIRATRLYLVARTAIEPGALVGEMREDLRELDADVPVYQAGTMEGHVDEALGLPRTGATVVALFGGLALFLASLGLYAVVAFAVSRRTAEMGLRIALGASGSDIVRATLRETMVVVLAGLAVGIATSLLAAPILESVLFDVAASDPVTFLLTAALLGAVALAAAYVPARRAARTDPVQALRFG